MVGLAGYDRYFWVHRPGASCHFFCNIGKFCLSCAGTSDDGPTTRDRWKRNHGSLHPGIVSLLKRSFDITHLVPPCDQVVFATILEWIFFHTIPTSLSVIGTLLIIGSAIYVVVN